VQAGWSDAFVMADGSSGAVSRRCCESEKVTA